MRSAAPSSGCTLDTMTCFTSLQLFLLRQVWLWMWKKGPDNLRPADVLVHRELSPSSRLFSGASFAKLCRSGGGMAYQVENHNILPACRRLGWSFCPFALEATGACGGKAKHLTQLNPKIRPAARVLVQGGVTLRCHTIQS